MTARSEALRAAFAAVPRAAAPVEPSDVLAAIRGPQGEQGPKGDTGAQGERGVQGVKGEHGYTGAAGAPAPVLVRADVERDYYGRISGIRQEFSDGTTAHQTVQRDQSGRVVSVTRS